MKDKLKGIYELRLMKDKCCDVDERQYVRISFICLFGDIWLSIDNKLYLMI